MMTITLSRDVNYVVSGLERSGTSVMMQILHRGGLPVAFDDSRPADQHNPRGYFELAGGKIINQLMDGTFPMEAHKGRVIKVTAYGLKFLPEGSYKIIYMLRNVDEVLNSMEKMGAEIDRDKDRVLFAKLNKFCFDLMGKRHDIDCTTVNYRDVIDSPEQQVEKISRFLGQSFDFQNAIAAVDSKLYRNRAKDS